MAHDEHKARAKKKLALAVLTLSDTRNEDEDTSGRLIKTKMAEEGHSIEFYTLIREDPAEIETMLRKLLIEPVDAIITNGGTGLSARDGTIEVAKRLMTKEIPGFGELFRLLSYHQIGPAAILSRATAGFASGKILVCLPGSTNAVKLAIERILIEELPHMVYEVNR